VELGFALEEGLDLLGSGLAVPRRHRYFRNIIAVFILNELRLFLEKENVS
jgi:hypothetical protein